MSIICSAKPNFTEGAGKIHLEALDGLRGLAAVAVVLHHVGSTFRLPYLVPRGYLAVDLFFALSGYVLTYAYAEQMPNSSIKMFVKRRVIRLYPMIVLGSLGGVCLALIRFRANEPALDDIILSGLLSSLALPMLIRSTLPYETFPINGPIWSLTFELFACFIFALAAQKQHLRSWALIMILTGGMALIPIAAIYHGISVGPIPSNWIGGFARVAFSFFAGVLLRLTWLKLPELPAIPVSFICLAPLAVPALEHKNGLIDLVSTLVLFPLSVLALSRINVKGRLLTACSISGEISYPLYAIHYPIVLAFASFWKLQASTPLVRCTAGLAITIILVGVAYLVSRTMDIPIRKYLNSQFINQA